MLRGKNRVGVFVFHRPEKKPTNDMSVLISQVIQAVTQLDPPVGDHDSNLQKGHVNSTSQKGHQQNCQEVIVSMSRCIFFAKEIARRCDDSLAFCSGDQVIKSSSNQKYAISKFWTILRYPEDVFVGTLNTILGKG